MTTHRRPPFDKATQIFSHAPAKTPAPKIGQVTRIPRRGPHTDKNAKVKPAVLQSRTWTWDLWDWRDSNNNLIFQFSEMALTVDEEGSTELRYNYASFVPKFYFTVGFSFATENGSSLWPSNLSKYPYYYLHVPTPISPVGPGAGWTEDAPDPQTSAYKYAWLRHDYSRLSWAYAEAWGSFDTPQEDYYLEASNKLFNL